MIRMIEVAPGVVAEFTRILLDLDIDFRFDKPGRYTFYECQNGAYRKVSKATDFLAAKFGSGVIAKDFNV